MKFAAAIVASSMFVPLLAWTAPAADLPSPSFPQATTLHHDLEVTLHPGERRITVRDRITLPGDAAEEPREVEFLLHGGLNPAVEDPGAVLTEAGSLGIANRYALVLPGGSLGFTVTYGGVIDHPLENVGEEYARGQMTTPGMISPDGVFLSASSFWYPAFSGTLLSFSLEATLPEGWESVTQGTRRKHLRGDSETVSRWEVDLPQDDIYLIAAPFVEYLREDGPFNAMVFLREPDQSLAERYLDTTVQYVRMYSDLLGPYPYGKFAMVENFWETGYGMPSFTLLGPRVLRFPFILHSSYPHEILHNWWGNGVFIDYGGGNWGEGLTAYLSDHLVKEQRGEGAEHRQTTLQKYADYVLEGRDLPLTAFRSRHGSVSEAVGYGKTLMLFHMLRRRLGDEDFSRALKNFYEKNLFRTAGWGELRDAFEKAGGTPLEAFFDQWVLRAGAPELRLEGISVREEGGEFILSGRLLQVQGGEPFEVRVPVAVTVAGQKEVEIVTVPLGGESAAFEARTAGRPLRVDADPAFDLFRRLHPDEIPPALSRAFGAERPLILLPASAGEERKEMYRALTASLSRTGPGKVEIAADSDFPELPPDRSVWLLGWENRFFPLVAPLVESYGASLSGDRVRLGRGEFAREGGSFVLTVPHPRNAEIALLWIGTDNPAAVPGLGRKLPHYHKYSYLAFGGDEPENVAKGRWEAASGPLTVVVEESEGLTAVPRGDLPRPRPLAELEPLFSEERMMETIRFLAAEELEGRGIGTPGLDRAAEGIAEAFRRAGLQPGGDGDGSFFQTWTHRDGHFPGGVRLRNVVGLLPGTREEWRGQRVVVAAHYDHLGRGDGTGGTDFRKENVGRIHPGADDNASGVAVLVEIARILAEGKGPERTVVFAAFTGEEAGMLGARHFVESGGTLGTDGCLGMLNIDTVGRLEGKKLLVLGGRSASEWVHIFRGAGYLAGVEVEMAADGLDASDEVCFHDAGVPAVQITTGPHLDYHRPGDRPEKIDGEGLVRIASVAREVVDYLAQRPELLTATLDVPPGVKERSRREGSGRRTSLGTIPDFGWGGPGVRLTGVVPGSPAEKAGLSEGDIVTAVGTTAVSTLREYSDLLGSFDPGAKVILHFTRDGEEKTVEAVLVER